MGHTRFVHHASAVAALAFLSGCNWSGGGTTDELQKQIIDGDVAAIQRDEKLELKIAELERKIAMLELDIATLSSAHDSLLGTVNKNADIADRNALSRMTASGACGRDRVDYPDGSWTFRNRQCTKADLK